MTTFATRVSTDSRAEPDAGANPRGATTPGSTAAQNVSRAPSIADRYSGLLDDLSAAQRRGLIAKLANGYYDGWRPTRTQMIRYLHSEYGVTAMTIPSPGELLTHDNAIRYARSQDCLHHVMIVDT